MFAKVVNTPSKLIPLLAGDGSVSWKTIKENKVCSQDFMFELCKKKIFKYKYTDSYTFTLLIPKEDLAKYDEKEKEKEISPTASSGISTSKAKSIVCPQTNLEVVEGEDYRVVKDDGNHSGIVKVLKVNPKEKTVKIYSIGTEQTKVVPVSMIVEV